MPESSTNRVIIPSNLTGDSFLRTSYNAEFLDKLIGEEEFNGVVDKICKIAQICYIKKRKIDNNEVSK